MRIFKNKKFGAWAVKIGLGDAALQDVVDEMERGMEGDNLGGFVFKKRVAVGGRGKRGDRAFFVLGFAKNRQSSIKPDELAGLKEYAKELLGYGDEELALAVKHGALSEVQNDE